MVPLGSPSPSEMVGHRPGPNVPPGLGADAPAESWERDRLDARTIRSLPHASGGPWWLARGGVSLAALLVPVVIERAYHGRDDLTGAQVGGGGGELELERDENPRV